MQTEFLVYLLAASGCMGAFFFLYWLLLRNQTAFTFNRGFILISVGLSLVLPLVEIPAATTSLPTVTIALKNLVVASPSIVQAATFNGWEVAFKLYVAGVVLFASLFLYRLFLLWRLTHQFPSQVYTGFVLIQTEGRMPTFSFFRWLFWNNNENLTEAQREQIFWHEQTHIRQGHSADIILLEIVKIGCWFNPFIYLFQNSLRTVHEYLADREVVQESDLSTYAELILMQALSPIPVSFTQPFHSFQTKKRIVMLRIAQTQRPVFWRIAASVVLVAMFSLLYACQKHADKELLGAGLTGRVEWIEKIMPRISLSLYDPKAAFRRSMAKSLAREITYPASARKAKVEGIVYSSFIVHQDGRISNVKIEKGVSKELDDEVIRALKAFTPRRVTSQAESVTGRVVFPLRFTLMDEGYGIISMGEQ